MHKFFGLGIAAASMLFAVVPNSTNYTLKSYSVGNGGTSSSTSTNYKLNGTAGQQSSGPQTSTTYTNKSGVNATQDANVPPAPTFTNPGSYYDKLKLVLNTGSNPTDTKYLIAISPDGFSSTTNYVQADTSVGSSQAIANYQTYAAWGGASGFSIVGLLPSTTYTVKVKALQGDFSGSAFGPTASAATVAPSLTMSLATTLNSTPPFPVAFTLTPGTVANGAADALLTLTSNADNGGSVYTRDTNTGLTSTLASTTIASATANLAAATSGYGAQVTSATQSAGGPFTSQSPFNGTANTVGGLTTALQPILTTSSPITSGSATVRMMAKAAATTPSANDYGDTVTFVIAMNY